MPGVDIPAGDENTRERQETPKKESVLGLGKVQSAPTKPYGKQEQNLGRIFSSNCVQSVAHIQTCHKPSPTHGLVQITESYFFSLKAMEQVKVSEYGSVTFNIDTSLPIYLCDSQGNNQVGGFLRGNSFPKDIYWSGWKVTGSLEVKRRRKAGRTGNTDVLSFRTRGHGAGNGNEIVKEQLILNMNKILQTLSIL